MLQSVQGWRVGARAKTQATIRFFDITVPALTTLLCACWWTRQRLPLHTMSVCHLSLSFYHWFPLDSTFDYSCFNHTPSAPRLSWTCIKLRLCAYKCQPGSAYSVLHQKRKPLPISVTVIMEMKVTNTSIESHRSYRGSLLFPASINSTTLFSVVTYSHMHKKVHVLKSSFAAAFES